MYEKCGGMMPELPEVENVRRELLPVLIGERLLACELRRADVCESLDGAVTARTLLEGGTVAAIHRHGKQLAVVTDDGRAMCVHLGMTGSLELVDARTPLAPHTHIVWKLRSRAHEALAFRDPRRFGGLWCYPTMETLHTARWSTLGPDALNARAEDLAASARGSTRAVKAMLLDQTVIAGVGNIYADESLFAAGVSPHARAGKISLYTWGLLVEKLGEILRGAIAAGGSTIRDYRGPTGEPGGAQRDHKVYGRAGEPCVSCGRALRRGAVGQRTTVWCGGCQKR